MKLAIIALALLIPTLAHANDLDRAMAVCSVHQYWGACEVVKSKWISEEAVRAVAEREAENRKLVESVGLGAIHEPGGVTILRLRVVRHPKPAACVPKKKPLFPALHKALTRAHVVTDRCPK